MSAYEMVQEDSARKCSVTNAMSSAQEKLAMKTNFFQFITLRKWENMESEVEGNNVGVMRLLGGWKKLLDQNKGQKGKVALLKQKSFKVLRNAVQCV
jgi:hypothetical protein